MTKNTHPSVNDAGLRELMEAASQNAFQTSYPGRTDGPADAYRHILGIAEARRRYTIAVARAAGLANEISGNYNNYRETSFFSDASQMDRHNYEIGEKIGLIATNFEEVERMAHAEVFAAAIEGGTGRNGTAIYLEKSQWRGDNDRRHIAIVWPPRDLAKSSEVERILGRPPRTWTEEQMRKVQADPIYWNSNHPRQAQAFAAVRQWHEDRHGKRRGNASGKGAGASGGPVRVQSYTRGDGTQVETHTRNAPAVQGR